MGLVDEGLSVFWVGDFSLVTTVGGVWASVEFGFFAFEEVSLTGATFACVEFKAVREATGFFSGVEPVLGCAVELLCVLVLGVSTELFCAVLLGKMCGAVLLLCAVELGCAVASGRVAELCCAVETGCVSAVLGIADEAIGCGVDTLDS